MDDRFSTPRINATYVQASVGRRVILVGRVAQLRGETAVLDASGAVTLHLHRDSHLTAGNAAQVIGKVLPDLSVQVLTARDLGADVDMDLVNAVVDATHQLKSVFMFE